MATIHVDVVSAEESIFSGEAKFVALPGEMGELGIYPRHTPLITRIRPGAVRIVRADNDAEEFVFVAGGIGLAPVRCVIWNVLDLRDKFKDVTIVYGARSVGDLVYKRELQEWSKRKDAPIRSTYAIARNKPAFWLMIWLKRCVTAWLRIKGIF